MSRAITVVLAVLVLAASAGAVIVPPSPGGAGRDCTPDRVAKAVVKGPGAIKVIVHHPGRHTYLHYGGQRGFRLRAGRHSAAVFSDTKRPLYFHVLCERGGSTK